MSSAFKRYLKCVYVCALCAAYYMLGIFSLGRTPFSAQSGRISSPPSIRSSLSSFGDAHHLNSSQQTKSVRILRERGRRWEREGGKRELFWKDRMHFCKVEFPGAQACTSSIKSFVSCVIHSTLNAVERMLNLVAFLVQFLDFALVPRGWSILIKLILVWMCCGIGWDSESCLYC